MSFSENLASLALRAKIARGLLVAYFVLSLMSLPAGFIVGAGLLRQVPLQIIAYVTLAYSVLALAIVAGGFIAVIAWVHRAWQNLWAMKLPGLTFTPSWAAWSFVVPVANLFVPFVAMRELYNRSVGEDEYQSRTSAADVTSWWACFLGALFVTGFIEAATRLNRYSPGIYIVASQLVWLLTGLLASVLQLTACFFLWRIVGRVTHEQQHFTGFAEAFA